MSDCEHNWQFPLGSHTLMCVKCKEEMEPVSTIQQLQQKVDQLQDTMFKINQWAEAYPVDIFPEPDLEKAARVLKENGMTLDSISASNMRHVLSRLMEYTADFKAGQQTPEGWAEWWANVGSGITPLPDADMEEHTCRVSEKAFKAGQARPDEAERVINNNRLISNRRLMMKKITFEQQQGFFDVRCGLNYPVLGVIFNDHNKWKYEQRYNFFGFTCDDLRAIAAKIDELQAMSFDDLNKLFKRFEYAEAGFFGHGQE